MRQPGVAAFVAGALAGAACLVWAAPKPTPDPAEKPTATVTMEGESLPMSEVAERLAKQTGKEFRLANQDLGEKPIHVMVSAVPLRSFLGATALSINGQWRETRKGYRLEPKRQTLAYPERLAQVQGTYTNVEALLHDVPATDTQQGHALQWFRDSYQRANGIGEEGLDGWKVELRPGKVLLTSPDGGRQEAYGY